MKPGAINMVGGPRRDVERTCPTYTRKQYESVIIDDQIAVTNLATKGNHTVTIGVIAPPEVQVLRAEINPTGFTPKEPEKTGMMVFTRKINEEFHIGSEITVRVTSVHGEKATFAIFAPADIRVLRDSVIEQQNPSAEILQKIDAALSA